MAGNDEATDARMDTRGPYHHGNLREALVEAALDILAHHGAASLGLRRAARAAGVSPSAPYHHFGSKEGLLAAVAAEGFRRLAGEQAAAEARIRPTGEPDARVLSLGRSYIRFARRNPELYRLMFGPLIENRDDYPELTLAYQASYHAIELATKEYLAEHGDGSTTPKLAITGCWSLVHGLSNLLNDGKVVPGDDELPDEEELIEVVLGLWSRAMARGPTASG